MKLIAFFLLICSQIAMSTPAVHGMLLFGDKSTYVSHLPMFHEPHDYQFIAEVSLQDGEMGALKKYQKAKAKEGIFTLVPKPMELAKVIAHEITSFEATIYQGHFEQNGQPVAQVRVSIKNILVGEKIGKDMGESANFISFGRDGDYYLAHLIKGSPSYEAIYQTGKPQRMVIPPCGRAACPAPYEEPVDDSKLPLVMKADKKYAATHPVNVLLGFKEQVEVKEPLYWESLEH